eukprot:gene8673-9385_t
MEAKPLFVVLHGMPGCGKFTIGKKLLEYLKSEDTASDRDWTFFHNHLIVDAVIALFPFGSPNFRKYREEIWLSMIPDAIREGKNIIFTFSPDVTVNEDFPRILKERIENAGGKLVGVKIVCPNEEELVQRISSRTEFEKLKSAELYHQLVAQGAFDSPHFPVDFEVDSQIHTPDEAARVIQKFFC